MIITSKFQEDSRTKKELLEEINKLGMELTMANDYIKDLKNNNNSEDLIVVRLDKLKERILKNIEEETDCETITLMSLCKIKEQIEELIPVNISQIVRDLEFKYHASASKGGQPTAKTLEKIIKNKTNGRSI